MIKITLTGKIPSQKNRYEMARGKMYLHDDIKTFRELAGWKIKQQLGNIKPIATPVALGLRFHCDRRPDLDNLIATICDLLQKQGVIKNDRLVHEINAMKVYSNEEPVTEIRVITLPV